MEILIVLGGFVGLAIVLYIIGWFAELVEYTRLASRFSSDLEALHKRLTAIDIPGIREEFNQVNAATGESLVNLTMPDGRTINICPRCGAPVRATPTRKGIHISCTRKSCYGYMYIETTDKGFAEIRTT